MMMTTQPINTERYAVYYGLAHVKRPTGKMLSPKLLCGYVKVAARQRRARLYSPKLRGGYLRVFVISPKNHAADIPAEDKLITIGSPSKRPQKGPENAAAAPVPKAPSELPIPIVNKAEEITVESTSSEISSQSNLIQDKKLMPEVKPEEAPKGKPEEKHKKLDFFEDEKSLTQILQADINNIVNSDGYYDEILPEDQDESFEKKKLKKGNPKILALLAFMIALSLFIILISL